MNLPRFSITLLCWLASATMAVAEKANIEPSESPTPTPSPTVPATPTATPNVNIGERPAGAAPNATLETSDLAEFETATPEAQALIKAGLELTKLDLSYKYGSSDPKEGGMDCSGTIYYLLQSRGVKEPPRTASDQYVWVRKKKLLQPVLSTKEDTFEIEDLKPGDLLFWSGTYGIERDPPITHTMIYLGKEKKNGKRVMVGASDGRSYEGKKRYGVSVFDFKVSSARKDSTSSSSSPRFIGYATAPLPGIGDPANESKSEE